MTANMHLKANTKDAYTRNECDGWYFIVEVNTKGVYRTDVRANGYSYPNRRSQKSITDLKNMDSGRLTQKPLEETSKVLPEIDLCGIYCKLSAEAVRTEVCIEHYLPIGDSFLSQEQINDMKAIYDSPFGRFFCTVCGIIT